VGIPEVMEMGGYACLNLALQEVYADRNVDMEDHVEDRGIDYYDIRLDTITLAV
jgi:hypothetical protein